MIQKLQLTKDPLTPTNYNITDTPNHFIYTENIYAVYMTFDKKFSDKFSGKVGARYEITNSLGTSDNAQTPEYKKELKEIIITFFHILV